MAGLLDSITGFIGKNSNWLAPVVATGLGAFKQNSADTAANDYLSYLHQQEDQNYQNSVNNINQYNDQLSANNAAAGARAAAARQNQANAMRAAKKGNKVSQQTYKQVLAMYAPYKAVADQLLPQMTQTYQNSLGLQNALGQFVNSPAQVAKLNGSIPSYQVNVPLPDSIKIK